MRISDWSSDVCSSDLAKGIFAVAAAGGANTLGKVALGAAGSIGLAMVAAFAGIWLGLRKQLKGAIDDEERTALIRSSVINGLASIAFVACMLLVRSEEHTSELQSLMRISYAVFCLKKKKTQNNNYTYIKLS